AQLRGAGKCWRDYTRRCKQRAATTLNNSDPAGNSRKAGRAGRAAGEQDERHVTGYEPTRVYGGARGQSERAGVGSRSSLIVPFGDPNPRLQAKDKVDEVARCDDIEWALTPSTT